MSAIAVLYVIYAIVLIVGGFIGYRKTKSTMSLGAGSIAGVIACAAAFLLFRFPVVGLWLGTLVAIVLTIVFARRYQLTRKAMPAIPILVLSVIVLIVSLARLLPAISRPA